MRAMRLRKPGGLDHLYQDTTTLPPVGPNQVRVELHASSLNFHDYAVVTGRIPTEDGRIPMSDGAGEVVEIGEGVTEFARGDRVVSTYFPCWQSGEVTTDRLAIVPGDRGDGYARESVVAGTSAFTKAPVGFRHEEAATLTCAGLTAWRALFIERNLRPGETVLVQGSGGVSIFALQFAKAAGATVIATSSSDEKLEKLRTLGADHLINYRQTKEWGLAAKELTAGRGVDHVVEVGGAGTLEQSIAAVRLGGHIALIGVLAGYAGELPTATLMRKSIKISGMTVGSRDHQLAMIRAIDANGIRPVIDQEFPLEAIADAFRYQESGRHFGKICLSW